MAMDERAEAAALVPDRTIQIETTDQLRFTPDALTVRAGETIAFVVHNGGALPHEFVIGDAATQEAHEQEMTGDAAMNEEGEAGVEVEAGETATLVYTFDEPGILLFGCHVDGHYAAGMKGTITVEG
jgi:uncharacterized cupredoxin-like copper-binding protein